MLVLISKSYKKLLMKHFCLEKQNDLCRNLEECTYKMKLSSQLLRITNTPLSPKNSFYDIKRVYHSFAVQTIEVVMFDTNTEVSNLRSKLFED